MPLFPINKENHEFMLLMSNLAQAIATWGHLFIGIKNSIIMFPSPCRRIIIAMELIICLLSARRKKVLNYFLCFHSYYSLPGSKFDLNVHGVIIATCARSRSLTYIGT